MNILKSHLPDLLAEICPILHQKGFFFTKKSWGGGGMTPDPLESNLSNNSLQVIRGFELVKGHFCQSCKSVEKMLGVE